MPECKIFKNKAKNMGKNYKNARKTIVSKITLRYSTCIIVSQKILKLKSTKFDKHRIIKEEQKMKPC